MALPDRGNLYAAQLLSDLGFDTPDPGEIATVTAANRWRECGLEKLTGYPDRALRQCPVPVAEYADGALAALGLLSPETDFHEYRGADLLTLRARFTGATRNGAISPGGSCRILPCQDGTVAVNLARDSDWELLYAWLLCDTGTDWEAVAQRVGQLPKSRLVDQGRMLGLAIADAEPALPEQGRWVRVAHRGTPSPARSGSPRVIDLSSLWAGPLCSRLLQWMGAEIIKVESSQRPDGARFGSADFFQFLNAGKQELTLDLHTPAGVAQLVELIRGADIVIEGSRPRALRQLGISAEAMVDEVPGLTWIGISGYGRQEPRANWIAYGDDAGVAGGLSAEIHRATGQWMICGDAIADPLTGLHAALAGFASWQSGGGQLLSLSLVETVQHCVLSRLKEASA